MKGSKLTGYLTTMVVLGLIAFAFLAWAVQWREGRPVEQLAAESVEPAPAQRIAVLAAGANSSADTARTALMQDERATAAHALDAATRASRVGMHATTGETGHQFKLAHQAFKEARQALQNGNQLSETVAHIETAMAALTQAAHSDNGLRTELPELADLQDASVINAQGVRLGEIDRIEEGPDGRPQAVLVLGDGQNVLGVLDLGGQRVAVPADQLLLGKPQWLGRAHVAIPSLKADVTEVVAELEAAAQPEYAEAAGGDQG